MPSVVPWLLDPGSCVARVRFVYVLPAVSDILDWSDALPPDPALSAATQTISQSPTLAVTLEATRVVLDDVLDAVVTLVTVRAMRPS
jgi:hypothetical protein